MWHSGSEEGVLFLSVLVGHANLQSLQAAGNPQHYAEHILHSKICPFCFIKRYLLTVGKNFPESQPYVYTYITFLTQMLHAFLSYAAGIRIE